MRRILTSLIAIFITTMAWAAPLGSIYMFDTGVFSCDGTTREIVWKNIYSVSPKIVLIQIWMGMDMGGKSDYWFELKRKSDGCILGHSNWDHYTDPVSVNSTRYMINYQPDYIEIKPGDSIILRYGCTKISYQRPNGHIVVTAWYK